MSAYGITCDAFKEAVAKLVEDYVGHINGLDIAHILQRAATKELKACHGGTYVPPLVQLLGSDIGEAAIIAASKADDAHQLCGPHAQALFEVLNQAMYELIADIPAAQKRHAP